MDSTIIAVAPNPILTAFQSIPVPAELQSLDRRATLYSQGAEWHPVRSDSPSLVQAQAVVERDDSGAAGISFRLDADDP
ncbi:MAG: hypothetical protein P4L85_07800 [Paludisphaera borealis]|uniref:hypothetical protein n=1 Tax=Paludisphaera borealis TaxID=1387353 RepID=UPI00284C2EE3|nr:hypothetical protein [Paludisphaera borealis]MDR3619237.1 hypothetical protein [Paludisphaera borealis]